MKLTTQDDFLEKLQQHKKNNTKAVKDYKEHNLFEADSKKVKGKVLIEGQRFSGFYFCNIIFDGLYFSGCVFMNCQFYNMRVHNVRFDDCKFLECEINETWLMNGDISNCNFETCTGSYFNCLESTFSDVTFSANCFSSFYFRDNIFYKVVFELSTLSNCIFESNLLFMVEQEIKFYESAISDCFFRLENFYGPFEDCQIERISFIDCSLSSNTFVGHNICSTGEFSSMDLHTLVNSEEMNPVLLKSIFGVREPKIKNLINDMVVDLIYQSVFISHSFNDGAFAQNLYNSMVCRGIKTFLWKEDAPAGQSLKKIMLENIKKHDRLLFIASQHSLKSDACHFELSEARKIQDKEWKDIYFPIHIDNFLFEIEEEYVRPREKRQEIWRNILELREINSIDFSQFNISDYDKEAFEKEVDKLIEALRAKK